MGRFRSIGKRIAVMLVLGTLLLAPGGVTMAGGGGAAGYAAGPMLQGRWAPENRLAVEELIREHGYGSANYSEGAKPFAVFDWDDTSVINDTGLTLFIYQIDNLTYPYTVTEFAAKVRQDLKADTPIYNDLKQPKTLGNMAEDVIADYALLVQDRSLTKQETKDAFLDFKVKMLIMYWAVAITNPDGTINLNKPWWSMHFMAGMTQSQVQALAQEAHTYNLRQARSVVQLTSPNSRPGQAGVFTTSYETGLRLVPEIANLMQVLQANGIDVFVVTGGLEEEVAVLATSYGYNLPRNHVNGVRLATDSGGKYTMSLAADRPEMTIYQGKTDMIKQIRGENRVGPVLVGGDSDGDLNMMQDFPVTEHVLLMNRAHPEYKVLGWCLTRAGDKCLLQGRNEYAGHWLPESGTIPLPHVIP